MAQTNVQPQYEDFEPSFDWLQDAGSRTLYVMLPGFKKDDLKVQITSTRILRVSGERKITEENKVRRFRKELPIPNDADTSGIRAKFESGVLYVWLPKIIAPREKTEPPPKEEQDYEKKELKEEKGKVEEKDVKKGAKDEGASSRGEGEGEGKKVMEKRSNTLEMVSRQTQEYKNAVYGLVEKVKRQRKFANLVMVVLFVLVFVLYVKNAIKSYFGGGAKSQGL